MGNAACRCYKIRDQISTFPVGCSLTHQQRDYHQLLPRIFSGQKKVKQAHTFTDQVANPQFIATGTLQQVLNGSSLPKELHSTEIHRIVCGAEHFLALSKAGQVFGCGSNKQGQLGQEGLDFFDHLLILREFDKNSELKAVDVACGSYFSVVLLKGKTRAQKVLTFGESRYLGVKQIHEGWNSYSLHQKRSTHIPQMVKLDALQGERIHFISVNYRHACIVGSKCFNSLLEKGTVLVFGEDFSGFHLKSPKKFFKFPHRLLKLTLGRGHGLALTCRGQVFSWGDDTFSEVGSSIISNSMEQEYDLDRNIIKNTKLPQMLSNFELPAVDIATGARHSSVLLISGALYCFGDNSEEQCGKLYQQRCSKPTMIEVPSSETVIQFGAIFSGEAHNIGVSQKGKLYSWGGSEGILQIGKGLDVRSPISEVDIAKGKTLSHMVLSHNNSVLLTGDGSREVGEEEHFGDSSEPNSN